MNVIVYCPCTRLIIKMDESSLLAQVSSSLLTNQYRRGKNLDQSQPCTGVGRCAAANHRPVAALVGTFRPITTQSRDFIASRQITSRLKHEGRCVLRRSITERLSRILNVYDIFITNNFFM